MRRTTFVGLAFLAAAGVARAVPSLSHPHSRTLHEIGHHKGADDLVMR